MIVNDQAETAYNIIEIKQYDNCKFHATSFTETKLEINYFCFWVIKSYNSNTLIF